MMAEIWVQLGQLLIVVLIGYVAQKKLFSDGMADHLSDVVLWIALPCAMLGSASIDMSRDSMVSVLVACGAAALYYGLAIGLSELLAKRLRMPAVRKGVFCCSITFANTAFIGYPMSMLLAGEKGVFYASFFNMVWNLFFFTYGVSRLAGARRNGLRTLLSQDPSLLVMVLMLFVFLFRIRFPAPIRQLFDLLGGMCTPLSMLAIGCMLAKMELKSVWRDQTVYLVSAMRLVILPLLMLPCALVLRHFIVDKELLLVIIILCAMPSGSLIAVFSKKYGADAAYASGAVMHSMVLFVFTIPLMVLLAKLLL